MTIEEILQSHHNFAVEKGKGEYEVVFTYVNGSQNYNLSDELSDVDTISVVVPAFKRIVYNNTNVYAAHDLVNGLVVVEDLNHFFYHRLCNGSLTGMEALFTQYYIASEDYKMEVLRLRANADMISRAYRNKFIIATRGLLASMEARMRNPNLKYYNEEFGYNTKMLATARYAQYLLEHVISGFTIRDTIRVPDNQKNYFINLKRGLTKEESPSFTQTYLLCDDAITDMEPIGVPFSEEGDAECLVVDTLTDCYRICLSNTMEEP